MDIMTKDGWKPLLPEITIKDETWKNPFKGYQDFGFKTFEEWLRK